ncbi:putative pentatricopeptide repeat-containing protein at1g56570 [Phtheirospermum japonicum]|uniref:Putative pentatricopeptide repeat-containing protein at1g56570 n=1 Tax=Phtheirospermum japonicum TaxID=374723 RepID=A0A830B5U3_9LAMI|nr:putative pentatricopeptide repeat-containing protein at1g56570 [Phtheirospermum japonicum]
MSSRKLAQLPHLSISPIIHNSFSYRPLNSWAHSNSSPFLYKPPSILATDLIKSYFETGLVSEARKLFEEMPDRDVVAWSAMISGYTSCNLHTKAWAMFSEMLRDGATVQPNEFSFSSVLKACKSMNSLACGVLAHGLALKHGVIRSIYVANTLMDMYATCCDCMDRACAVFDDIREEAELNPFNVSIAIRACASIGSQLYGEQIHATVIKNGFQSSIPVMNSILDMYSRCTCPNSADRCFHMMKERDIITWNTLIAGYEKSNPHEALTLYSTLELENLSPNRFTFTSVLAAVANMAVLRAGEQIHGGVVKRGLGDDLGVANALIDMYAKCGSISSSCKIFDCMHAKNVVSWTSMIIGYGNHGHGPEAVDLFDRMVRAGVRPDRIVFVAVLNACSHSGLVDEGLRYFESMVSNYGITPDQEIYGCVVDLLGRAGRVEEAYELIQGMPFMPDESVWGAFLGACKAHKVSELGRLAAGRVLEMRPSVTGTYLALSGIYAADGKWGDFARMRKMLRGTGSKKEAGRSWIEVRNEMCSFVAGDKLGAHIEWVYEAVDMLTLHIKETGCDDDLRCLICD